MRHRFDTLQQRDDSLRCPDYPKRPSPTTVTPLVQHLVTPIAQRGALRPPSLRCGIRPISVNRRYGTMGRVRRYVAP